MMAEMDWNANVTKMTGFLPNLHREEKYLFEKKIKSPLVTML